MGEGYEVKQIARSKGLERGRIICVTLTLDMDWYSSTQLLSKLNPSKPSKLLPYSSYVGHHNNAFRPQPPLHHLSINYVPRTALPEPSLKLNLYFKYVSKTGKYFCSKSFHISTFHLLPSTLCDLYKHTLAPPHVDHHASLDYQNSIIYRCMSYPKSTV